MGWLTNKILETTEQQIDELRESISSSSGVDLAVPPSRKTVPQVTEQSAMNMTAVLRAVEIHVIAAKQMGIDVFSKGRPLKSVPLIIKKPSQDEPRSVTMEKTVFSLVTRSNCYWKKTYSISDRTKISSIEVLDTDSVVINKTEDGKLKNYTYKNKDIPKNDIIHMAVNRQPGQIEGLSRITAARNELSGMRDVIEYASTWFDKGFPGHGTIESENAYDEEYAKMLKDEIKNSNGGRDGFLVLGNGFHLAPSFLKPEDAQWIQSQQFDITRICRLFSVPASLMLAQVDGNSMTYQNVDQDWLGFIRFGHMVYSIEIETALSELLPNSQEAKFNIDALLRSDTITRYTAHKLGIDAGWLQKNEARKIENLDPLPELDQTNSPLAPPAVDPPTDSTSTQGGA